MSVECVTAPFKQPRLYASEISLLDQAPREEAEIKPDLLKQAEADPGVAQGLLEIIAEMARANPVVMPQRRSILDGPQPVKTGAEAWRPITLLASLPNGLTASPGP